MDSLISKLKDYKGLIKAAIRGKFYEINDEEKTFDLSDNLSEYAEYIKNNISPYFEQYFNNIGYDGIPKELLETLRCQSLYNISKDKRDLGQSLFVGADFEGSLENNRRCIILFTDSLYGKRICQYLRSLQEVYSLNSLYAPNLTDINNLKVSKVDPYWFFYNSKEIVHIYAILDAEDIGYTQLIEGVAPHPGDYFFSAYLRNGNNVTTAAAPKLQTLYMKNIHRAYNFGNSPLSMDSVLYCINNALYDADYANNEEKNYKFTLKNLAYTEEQRAEIQNAVVIRAAALGENGLNMQIVFV